MLVFPASPHFMHHARDKTSARRMRRNRIISHSYGINQRPRCKKPRGIYNSQIYMPRALQFLQDNSSMTQQVLGILTAHCLLHIHLQPIHPIVPPSSFLSAKSPLHPPPHYLQLHSISSTDAPRMHCTSQMDGTLHTPWLRIAAKRKSFLPDRAVNSRAIHVR